MSFFKKAFGGGTKGLFQAVLNPLGHIGQGIGGKTGGILKKISDPLGLFEGPRKPGDPPQVEDPQKSLQRQAVNAAVAGDIAVRNAQRQSSTLGAGTNFLKNMSGPVDTGPTFFDDRFKEKRKKAQQ